jgi:immunoglobulin-binding protein 1
MSDTEEQSDQSLSSTFASAESLREQIASGSLPSNEALPKLIQLYTQCAKLIHTLSLFSPNETLEDISSSELQYLLVDYFLADALFRQQSQGGPARKETVLEARSIWERFLRRLDEYELLNKQESRLWELYLEDRDAFEVGGGLDATGRRQMKITRFREEKNMKAKLEALRRNPSLATTDDGATRELHLSHIALRVHETFQNLEFASLELQMLKMAPPPQQPAGSVPPIDERERGNRGDGYSERLDQTRAFLTNKTGPILDKSGKPLRPFTILDKRTQLQQGVFRPDHSLPTMSIDEYLAEEKKRGGIIEGGGAASGIRQEIDQDDHDKMDEETMKARAWDDFQEENPKGSGNTLNRG